MAGVVGKAAMTDLAPPKKRDSTRTREMILQAGQRLFADRGYSVTGIRDIADAAQVAPSLVMRYFGSKEGLLRAALEELLQVDALIKGPRDQFGIRVTELFFHAENIPSPVGMMMLATSDDDALRLCQQMLDDYIVQPLATWLGSPDGLDRAIRLNLIWMGYFAARRLTKAENSRVPVNSPTLNWLAQMTQAIADGHDIA